MLHGITWFNPSASRDKDGHGQSASPTPLYLHTHLSTAVTIILSWLLSHRVCQLSAPLMVRASVVHRTMPIALEHAGGGLEATASLPA
jgi:hypothetical protein